MTPKSRSRRPSPPQPPAPSAGPQGGHAPTARRTEMSDDDHVQVSIFQPPISVAQRRLAVRYDALRGALGKLGRPYPTSSALILPAPLLLLDRGYVPESQRGDYPSKLPLLVFSNPIPRADSVTLWDAQGRQVGHAYPFQPSITVTGPGEGGTVEVRDRHGVTFMVGVPLRTIGIPGGTGPYSAAVEEILVDAFEEGRVEGRAEAREESVAETPKE